MLTSFSTFALRYDILVCETSVVLSLAQADNQDFAKRGRFEPNFKNFLFEKCHLIKWCAEQTSATQCITEQGSGGRLCP